MRGNNINSMTSSSLPGEQGQAKPTADGGGDRVQSVHHSGAMELTSKIGEPTNS